MRNKLGEQGTALWNTSVKLNNTTIVVKAGDKTIVPAGTTLTALNSTYGINPVFTTEVKDNATAVTTDKDANSWHSKLTMLLPVRSSKLIHSIMQSLHS